MKHHTFADWDFQNANWTLDGTIYHTEAPSLHGLGSNQALIKHATTGALSNGRLVFWTRSSSIGYLTEFSFRDQVADGNADQENTYRLTVKEDEMTFDKYIAGTPNPIDTKAFTWVWAINAWYKIRVTWWTSVDRIYVRVERWTGTEWVTLGGEADTDFEDTDDQWKDNPVNRCGPHLISSYSYIDDLEVWG
jgi:hypothetical protein